MIKVMIHHDDFIAGGAEPGCSNADSPESGASIHLVHLLESNRKS